MADAGHRHLPYGRQWIDGDDREAVQAVLGSDFLTTGPAVDEFETALSAKVGAEYAVVCSSGTAALHLAALALGIGPGDQVVVPSITFLATANAARYVGAEVVFADVDPESGLMRASDLSAALETCGNAKAVFPVHLGGQTADMVGLEKIAAEHGLYVVEDACHALGTTYDDGVEIVGNWASSQLAVFSFHPVKTVTMGEGGAVTTNDPGLAERMKRLRNSGMSAAPEQLTNTDMAFDETGARNPWYYEMHEIGFNYRASDIHCALGLSQLSKLDSFVQIRSRLVQQYDELIAGLAPIVRPVPGSKSENPAWHLYRVLIDFGAAGLGRSQLMRRLAERGIGTQVHYIPVHLQPYYRERYGAGSLPGAVKYYERCLSLPLHAAMTDEDVNSVANALRQALEI